jgi:hypothetical protein
MATSAHDAFDHVEFHQGLGFDFKQAITCGDQIDLALARPGVELHAFAGETLSQDQRGVVFVHHFRWNIKNIKMVFAQTGQVFQIGQSDDMAFFKGRTLKGAISDFRDIVSQDCPDGIGQIYHTTPGATKGQITHRFFSP